MSCIDKEFVVVCGKKQAGGDSIPLREVTIFNDNGSPRAVYYYEPTNLLTPIDTTNWRISPTACASTVSERAVCVKLSTLSNPQWDVVERITTDVFGASVVTYYDPDASPMIDITSTITGNILSVTLGSCVCCSDF